MVPGRDWHYVYCAMFRVAAGLILFLAAPRDLWAATLSDLISRARQEGAFQATATSSMKGETAHKLAVAFRSRFGLDSKVTVTPLSDTQNYPKYAVETKVGAVPTYDAVEGSGPNNTQLAALGGLQRIDQWEVLLAQINPLVGSGKANPKVISPGPLSGYAFHYVSRLKAIIYNPRLISEKELPKTHAELGDPRFKGIWVQPPFAAHWDVGPLVFPDIPPDRWIETVRKAGRNAGAVLHESAGVERVALGEFAFIPANEYYFFQVKARDPQAPLALSFFRDYNPVTGSYYAVRTRSRSPAAATLFALWMGTPEAKSIWQPDLFSTQFEWGEGPLDDKIRQLLRESGAKTVSFFDSERHVKFLSWLGTDEGRKYRTAIGRAIRGE